MKESCHQRIELSKLSTKSAWVAEPVIVLFKDKTAKVPAGYSTLVTGISKVNRTRRKHYIRVTQQNKYFFLILYIFSLFLPYATKAVRKICNLCRAT